MPVSGSSSSLYIGREYAEVDQDDLQALLQGASDAKFDFVVIPLFCRAPGARPSQGDYELRPSAASDLVLDSKTWNSSVVGILSDWLDPSAAATPAQRELCCNALDRELRWASHLGVYGIMLPPPSGPGCQLYAAALLRTYLSAGICSQQFMIRIPLLVICADGKECDGWEIWNELRLHCDQSPRLQVALELTSNLPGTDMDLQRWLAEPVRAVVVPADVFLTNDRGNPTLSKRHKQFLLRMFSHRVQIVMQGLPDAGTPEAEQQADAYLNSVARLFQSKPALSSQEQFELPYHDYLQLPLQPLQDDLESQTYETFEKDPVKYVQYEEAIFRWMMCRLQEPQKGPLAIIVVGAGRGPLVVSVRSAAKRANAEVRVWAVEKNPNAVITLRHRSRLEEWDDVEIVAVDMRYWTAPTKADLLVSELLGSFGDNELSPECLDGAQRFLAPDGQSIPSKYTSYLTPVTTPKLWNDVKNYGDLLHFETPYVVRFHQAVYPAREVKECFTFTHPNWDLESNDRYAEIEFVACFNSLIHGFAGYFRCELYDGLGFSINPDNYSEGMFSWFPIFFPLRTPIALRQGQTLRSHWWRCHNDKKVWYEWAVSEPTPGPVHNPGGRSYYIGK